MKETGLLQVEIQSLGTPFASVLLQAEKIVLLDFFFLRFMVNYC